MEGDTDLQKHIAAFMLDELRAIEAERLRLRQEVTNRLNTFLTLTSGFVGALVFFGPSLESVRFMSPLAVAFLVIIGLQNFFYTVNRDINSDRQARAAGRVRRCFYQLDPAIAAYLSERLDDEPSHYIRNNSSSVRRSLQIILSLLIGTVAGLTIYLYSSNTQRAITAMLALFLLFPLVFEIYAQSQFRRARRRAQAEVRFPALPRGSSAQHTLSSQPLATKRDDLLQLLLAQDNTTG